MDGNKLEKSLFLSSSKETTKYTDYSHKNKEVYSDYKPKKKKINENKKRNYHPSARLHWRPTCHAITQSGWTALKIVSMYNQLSVAAST